jgi:hypothetical protein
MDYLKAAAIGWAGYVAVGYYKTGKIPDYMSCVLYGGGAGVLVFAGLPLIAGQGQVSDMMQYSGEFLAGAGLGYTFN